MPDIELPAKRLLFAREEFDARLAAIRAAMAQRDIELLIVDETEILHYITGYTISQNLWRCCLVPASGEPVMVLRELDLRPFLERTWLTAYHGFRDWEDPVAIVAEQIGKRDWAALRIGTDPESTCMTVGRMAALRAALPDAGWREFGGVLRELRLNKSEAEIGYLKAAARVADGAMLAGAAAAGPGMTERDVAAVMSEAFVRLGADHGRVGPVTAAGGGWGFLHGHLHDRPLNNGEILHVELVPTVNGYGARLMRPVVIGSPEPFLATARTIVEIQDRQIAAMRPGADAREVDAILRDGLIRAGLRESYDNPTGYTLGFFHFSSLRTSDFTRFFHPRADWRLEPGMVFHMYTSAAGLAFSETVLVRENGPERLTRLPRIPLIAGRIQDSRARLQ